MNLITMNISVDVVLYDDKFANSVTWVKIKFKSSYGNLRREYNNNHTT